MNKWLLIAGNVWAMALEKVIAIVVPGDLGDDAQLAEHQAQNFIPKLANAKLPEVIPDNWDWGCVVYYDLQSQYSFSNTESILYNRHSCLICNNAKEWKDQCREIPDSLHLAKSATGDFSGFGSIRSKLGDLPGMNIPSLLDFVQFNFWRTPAPDISVSQCSNQRDDQNSRNSAHLSYLNQRGFVYTYKPPRRPMTFEGVQYGHVVMYFKTPLTGCPADHHVEIRANIGITITSTPGVETGIKNIVAGCYTSTPPLTVTCKYKDRQLSCPATDLLRSIHYVGSDEYLNLVVDLDTFCGPPETTEPIFPEINVVEFFYFQPRVTTYYPTYQSKVEDVLFKSPRCWFSAEDVDYIFAGSWIGEAESRSLMEHSWTYGIVSEQQCLQMGGTPVGNDEFKKYYGCETGSMTDCGVNVDGLPPSAVSSMYPVHRLRSTRKMNEEPY